MDLKDEFQRARDYVANQLDFSHLGRDGNKVSVFETIIREVGGLLSAFDLSGDIIFKQRAKELMDLLTAAYDEKEGVFYTLLNPYTKEKTFASWAGYRAHIADIGTLQLETRYLSDITGDPKYAEMGDAFYQILKREGSYKKTGLFPVHFDASRGKFDTRGSVITLGALGDSFYEYLLKVYIYSGKREEDEYLRELNSKYRRSPYVVLCPFLSTAVDEVLTYLVGFYLADRSAHGPSPVFRAGTLGTRYAIGNRGPRKERQASRTGRKAHGDLLPVLPPPTNGLVARHRQFPEDASDRPQIPPSPGDNRKPVLPLSRYEESQVPRVRLGDIRGAGGPRQSQARLRRHPGRHDAACANGEQDGELLLGGDAQVPLLAAGARKSHSARQVRFQHGSTPTAHPQQGLIVVLGAQFHEIKCMFVP
ncbi:hypothetical protein ON010_g17972 [Phytophthora cinnamomi]|nr:hypothetical protein ON010_g17972 [Phytophthora cinnamomi]